MSSNVVFVLGVVVLVVLRFVLFHFIRHGPDTLIMYVIGFDDPENINNINYFLEHGIRCGGSEGGGSAGGGRAGACPCSNSGRPSRVLTACTSCFRRGFF